MTAQQETGGAENREYARVDTRFEIRFRKVEIEEAADIEERVLERASVWAPANDEFIRKLALGTDATSKEMMIAGAIRDLTRELVRLREVVRPQVPGSLPGTVISLSGSGGRFIAPEALLPGDLVDLQFQADEAGTPPIRSLVRIVHQAAGPLPKEHGFRFEALHPEDRDRLVRWTFRVQRQALREASRP